MASLENNAEFNPMKIMKKPTVALTCFLFAGCFPVRNGLIVRDDNLNPQGAQNQLELAPWRGSLGHGFYPPASKDPERYFRHMGSGKKSWVLEHWGTPDEFSWLNGTEFHTYNKRSKNAPKYTMQEERYVKLGYRQDKLVSIEAFFSKCPKAWNGPVYVLPK